MRIENLHSHLATEILRENATDDNALGLMLLFHTHRIRLREAILEDRPGVVEIDALTQRSAAEGIAASWPDRNDLRRTDQHYWFHEFNGRTPYEVIEDIPADWMRRIRVLCDMLIKSEIVDSLRVAD